MTENPYTTLGVDKNATADEIKKAYRKKAKEYHPDANQDDPDAEENFKKISTAYEALKDPEKRAAYDRFGTTDASGMHPDYDPFNSPHMKRRRAQWGYNQDITKNNINENVSVPLSKLKSGGTVRVSITIPIPENGWFTLQQKVIGFNIEPNTPVGTRVILGKNDHKLDKIDNIIIDIHPMIDIEGNFQLNGLNIYMQFDLDVFDSICGNTVAVQLPTNDVVSVTIPRGVSSNQKIRLSGKGLVHADGRVGDIILVTNIQVPQLSDEQIEKISSIINEESG